MSSTQTATQTRAGNARGRGASRGRRGRGGQKNNAARDPTHASKPVDAPSDGNTEQQLAPSEAARQAAAKADASGVDDGTVCWICAEPVKYWSVSECNHRTCHVCALRLRALYKKLECTFCKESQPSVIFTTSADELWAAYTPDKIPYKDAKLAISFETQEMMEETLILLRFNCPDAQCDFIGNGWSDLKLHTRAMHGKLMCDICIRFKKVFAHEHALYDPSQLPLHLPMMARGNRHAHTKPSQQIEGGIHPLCEFCRECFFGDDEIYAHMREKHEECFVCKRNEVKDQYFRNYEALEDHFMHAHYPCRRAECLARKFVVFGSAIDLKAHMVEDHGADMSARDRRDARRVEADFEFEEVSGAGARRGRRERGDRDRDREPPPHTHPVGQPPGSGARPQAAGARRREAFSGALTAEAAQSQRQAGNASQQQQQQQATRRQSPSPDLADLSALVRRLQGLAPNPATAVPAVKAAVRSYKASESSARDLISTVWNVLDRNLDGTASVVNALIDVVDEDDKKQSLLTAWNGFKVEQRNQFPELVPTATGSEWSGVTSGRVLNAKNSTVARSHTQSSRQLLDRVARAAASTSAQAGPSRASAVNSFPPLQSGAASGSSATPFRQQQRVTPWASGGAASAPAPAPAPVVRVPTSVPGPGAKSKGGPAAFSKSAFPELPSGSQQRVPKGAVGGNQSLRKILGGSAPDQPAWHSGGKGNGSGGDSGTSTPGEPSAAVDGEVNGVSGQGQGGGGKKKGKGKQKQTLFTLGSFPS
ncbi:E3 ubiquitin-protein ligase hel2 [Trametes pubescens]|uniref:RING-type E3 ubiquitin transferase n=1 Tax=Trametes pubescens TaxID=154538 RepID=A0A1M2VEU1_TRAPU|nr:E3 ubiquitin-protein ligase hel2 [Trametes pubescens]